MSEYPDGAGVIAIATPSEIREGTNDKKAITPKDLKDALGCSVDKLITSDGGTVAELTVTGDLEVGSLTVGDYIIEVIA